jgi:hypothetical protein
VIPKHPVFRLLTAVLVLLPAVATGGDLDLSAADALHVKGDPASLEAAVALYEKAAAARPDRYEVHWKCARACRDVGDRSKKQLAPEWQATCARYGRKAMAHALAAIQLAPERVEGHYFYGLSVGTYSDGVSVFTALREGLKDKTQKHLEKAYTIDRMFDQAGPILALARFWAVLPWPLKDKRKALAYHQEYGRTPFYPDSTEAQVYLAELLLDMGGRDNRARAAELLAAAALSADPYWRRKARELTEK